MITPSEPGHGGSDPGLSAIMGERRQLVNLAYRLLGSLAEAKDIDALIALLDPDATTIADGGGLAGAALHPIEGVARIARHCLDIAGRATGDVAILERTVNGQPGLVFQREGVTVTVYAFEIADDRIKRIWAVRNPDKLRLWTAGRDRRET